MSEQLPIKCIQEVRPCTECFDQFLRPGNGVITLFVQQAAFFLFYSAEPFGQFIASGYKNVRINTALLFQYGQKLILTGVEFDFSFLHTIPSF